jgi:hypothetical protein
MWTICTNHLTSALSRCTVHAPVLLFRGREAVARSAIGDRVLVSASGKSFIFDVRTVWRSRKEPFWQMSKCHIVPSYHGNVNQHSTHKFSMCNVVLITKEYHNAMAFFTSFKQKFCDNLWLSWFILTNWAVRKNYNWKTNQKLKIKRFKESWVLGNHLNFWHYWLCVVIVAKPVYPCVRAPRAKTGRYAGLATSNVVSNYIWPENYPW